MANQLELIQEAVRRGLRLPPEKQELYDEAVRRGLIQDARPQAQPEDTRSLGDRALGMVKSVGTGIGQGALAVGNTLSDIGSLAERGTAYMFGIEPEQMEAVRQARAQLGVGTPRSLPEVQGKVEEVTGPFYQPQGTLEEYGNTMGQFLPSLLMGPGATWKQSMKLAALPTLLGAGASETAGQVSEGEWYEPYARMGGGVIGGLLGGGLNNMLATPKAPIADVSPGAQRRVGTALTETFPDEQAALARAGQLGDDAMVMNLGDRPAMQATTIARYPGESANTVKEAVRTQLDRSGVRAAQDWDSAVGPSVSRYENELAAAAKKAGTSSMYELAKGRQIDPTPVQAAILKEITEAGNDQQSRAALKEIADLLMDPRTGGLTFDAKTGAPSLVPGTQQFIGDAGALVNARQRIGEIITRLGKEVSNNPADDLYQVGKRTSVGGRLNRIYKAMNDVLHQDQVLADADKVWSGAEKSRKAYEFGRTRLLGSGDTPIEPEALAAMLKNPKLTVEERAQMIRGLARRGTSILRDVRPNRNEGKAMGDAIATGNNLSRIGLTAGQDASDTVRNMAAREDQFAAQGNRAINNSVTSEALLGANEFPSPLLGNKDYASVRQTTLLGVASEGIARLANAMTRGAISAKRAKLANDAARLLTAKGAERDRIVRDLMAYANSLPSSNPVKSMIMQTVAPSVGATVAPRIGN